MPELVARVPLAGRHGRGAGRRGAFYAPEAFDLGTAGGNIPSAESGRNVARGCRRALTFTGS